MATLLQLKLIFGLYIFGASALFAALCVLAVYALGTKRKEIEYERDYELLEMYVQYAIICEPSRKFIKSKFQEIAKYKCKNNEKLQVLEQNFYKRFAHQHQLKYCQ